MMGAIEPQCNVFRWTRPAREWFGQIPGRSEANAADSVGMSLLGWAQCSVKTQEKKFSRRGRKHTPQPGSGNRGRNEGIRGTGDREVRGKKVS